MTYIVGFLLKKIVQIKFSLAIFDCFHYFTTLLILNNILILVRTCIFIYIMENIASYHLHFVQNRCSIEVSWQNDRKLSRVFSEVRLDFKSDITVRLHPGVPKGNQKYFSQMEKNMKAPMEYFCSVANCWVTH